MRAQPPLAVPVCPSTRTTPPLRARVLARALALTLLPLASCSVDSPVDPSADAAPSVAPGAAAAVQDLEVAEASGTSITLRWTQVEDGTGAPASYQVRHASSPLDWEQADIACEDAGDAIGVEASCTVEGLEPNSAYELQVMTFRENGGAWEGTALSEVVSAETGDADADDLEMMIAASAPSVSLSRKSGVWISRSEVRSLPKSGSAYENVRSAASKSCGRVDLSDQASSTNVCVMAKALMFARTGESRYRKDVTTAIDQIVRAGTYRGTALALGRELGAYVIAADLIDLRSSNRSLDDRFRSKLRTLRTTYTSGGGSSSLIKCHERRPNNWGAHCGATRAAIAVYLGDSSDLARTARVFKGYLGDRSSYAGFSYGSTSWQCDPKRPVGINGSCTRSGLSLSGALPDDQRRGGSFRTRPPKENYVWEAMQGLLAQAVILHRAGYDVWSWESRALRRSAKWLHDQARFPAEGDDGWQPYVLNHYYGTSFPTPRKARPGKNVGWTDWTHAR